MTERLLQFIWQFQYYNTFNLRTTAEEPVEVISAGQRNHHQGPDFTDARIRIGGTLLAGSVELHLEEAGWNRHAHANDPNYTNVILHVLWEQPVETKLGLPTLTLKERVSKILLRRFNHLMHSQSFVPCSGSVKAVPPIVWTKWKERLLAERLLRRSVVVESYLLESRHHWEEVCWWMLARNFGIPVNAEPFEALAKSLPLTVLARHRNKLHHLEALLLGQAGLLNGSFTDAYAAMLAKEYAFWKLKYGLQAIPQQVHFLRMRPGNFPTIRLAQLAMLLHTSGFLFAMIRESRTVADLYRLLQVAASDYWDTHYLPDEAAACSRKRVGTQMAENIVINTIVPLLFAYGHVRHEQPFKDKAMAWMEELSPEKNTITNNWRQLGAGNAHAWDSQALLELKKEYCDARRCLECAAGNYLLRAGAGLAKAS